MLKLQQLGNSKKVYKKSFQTLSIRINPDCDQADECVFHMGPCCIFVRMSNRQHLQSHRSALPAYLMVSIPHLGSIGWAKETKEGKHIASSAHCQSISLYRSKKILAPLLPINHQSIKQTLFIKHIKTLKWTKVLYGKIKLIQKQNVTKSSGL